jgi:hypothetical protein
VTEQRERFSFPVFFLFRKKTDQRAMKKKGLELQIREGGESKIRERAHAHPLCALLSESAHFPLLNVVWLRV